MHSETMRAAIFIALNLVAMASLTFADEKLPVLKVGGETYSNVTVFKVSATDIYFTSNKGLANAKLKDIDPALQKRFGYNATNAVVVERKQAEADVQYHMAIQGTPRPPDKERATPATTALTVASNSASQTASGPDVSKVEEMDNQIGVLYHQGQSTQALALAIETLKLSEDTLEPEHPMTTTCLNDLGWMYQNLGDYKNAEPIFRRCLAIRERILGPEHPYTATSLHNLAGLYMHMGKYSIAEPLFQRSLAINEKVFGPESMTVAMSLAVLAVDENYLGMNAKAETLMQRKLAIYEKLEGPEYPDTGRTLQSLGAIYYQMGNFAKSESFHQRALAVQEKNLV